MRHRGIQTVQFLHSYSFPPTPFFSFSLVSYTNTLIDTDKRAHTHFSCCVHAGSWHCVPPRSLCWTVRSLHFLHVSPTLFQKGWVALFLAATSICGFSLWPIGSSVSWVAENFGCPWHEKYAENKSMGKNSFQYLKTVLIFCTPAHKISSKLVGIFQYRYIFTCCDSFYRLDSKNFKVRFLWVPPFISLLVR